MTYFILNNGYHFVNHQTNSLRPVCVHLVSRMPWIKHDSRDLSVSYEWPVEHFWQQKNMQRYLQPFTVISMYLKQLADRVLYELLLFWKELEGGDSKW